jgi:hypothetical protein
MPGAPVAYAKRDVIPTPGLPAASPTINPSFRGTLSACLSHYHSGRLLTVTRMDFWKPRGKTSKNLESMFAEHSSEKLFPRLAECQQRPLQALGPSLLSRNHYNKGSSIQGLALRARREMHWHREAVRWGSP